MSNETITPKVRIADILRAGFQVYANKIGYQDTDKEYTLKEHHRIVEGIAVELSQTHGIKPGDRVAVVSQTSHAYIAIWHAALLGNFTLVPINNRLAPPEIKDIIKDCGATILATDTAHTAVAKTMATELSINTTSLESLAASARPALAPRDDIEESEIPVIVYTGGTTGLPKGVAISQKTYATCTYLMRYGFDTAADQTCFYTTTPLFHTSGYLYIFGGALSGNRTIIVPTFDIPTLVKDVLTYKVTHLAMIPVMIDMFLDGIEENPEPYQHLRQIIYGGAPASAKTIQRLKNLLPNVRLSQTYGMTEAVSPVTLLDYFDHEQGGDRLKSTGKPLPGVELVIKKADGSIADIGESGEIFIRANLMMSGYWNNPEATASAVSNGWYQSGDMGYLDEGSYLYVIDRAKDMIVTGGENVYSVEVERAIQKVANVAQVAVIGVPSEAWGEQVHAVILPAPGTDIDTDVLLADLRKELAGYKCPKSVEIRSESLPLTGVNKINKVELRKQFWGDSGKNVN